MEVQRARNMDVQDQDVQTLVEEYFPGNLDLNLHASIQHIVSCIHTEHRSFQEGPCLQTFVISYLDPNVKKRDVISSGGRAVIRLQLANDLLYELHISGSIASAMQCLDQMASWLSSQSYDIEAFDRYEEFLSALLNAGRTGRDLCSISIAKYAPIAPPPCISQKMVLKMAFAAFNMLRKDYGLPLLAEVPQLLADIIMSKHNDAQHATQNYLADLNQDALAVVRDFRSRYHHRYDDLKIYNFLVANNSQHYRNRIQAVREMPWLLRILSGMDKIHSYDSGEIPRSRRTDPRAVASITQAIDTGQALYASVAQAFHVPRATARWTRHRMLPHAGLFCVPRMDLLLAMLSWLPPEKRPKTDADWTNMGAVMSTLLPIFTAFCTEADLVDALITDQRYGAILSRWLRDLARPTLRDASVRIDRMKRSGNDPEDLKDYVNALLGSLRRIGGQTPHNVNGHVDTSTGMLLDWLASQSFYTVMGVSRRWHESMRKYLDEQGEPSPTVSIPGTTKWVAVVPYTHVKSLMLVELTTSDSLMEEGRIMGHCVGGYSQKCAMEDALIFSVRDVDGRRLSTAELAIQGDPIQVSLRQHKGRKNMPPPAHCEAAIAKLISLMNRTDFQERLATRRNFQKALRRKHDAVQEMQSSRVESYRRIEEDQAWLCAFDRPR